jgi:hypothetical protein
MGKFRPTAPSTLNRLNLHGPLLPCIFFIVVYALSHGIGISSFDTITPCRVFGLFGIKPRARASKGNLIMGTMQSCSSWCLCCHQSISRPLIDRTHGGHMLWQVKLKWHYIKCVPRSGGKLQPTSLVLSVRIRVQRCATKLYRYSCGSIQYRPSHHVSCFRQSD